VQKYSLWVALHETDMFWRHAALCAGRIGLRERAGGREGLRRRRAVGRRGGSQQRAPGAGDRQGRRRGCAGSRVEPRVRKRVGGEVVSSERPELATAKVVVAGAQGLAVGVRVRVRSLKFVSDCFAVL